MLGLLLQDDIVKKTLRLCGIYEGKPQCLVSYWVDCDNHTINLRLNRVKKEQ